MKKSQKITLKNVRCIAYEEKEGMKCSLLEQESELPKKTMGFLVTNLKVKPVNKVVCISSATFGCNGAGMA